ncbi:MAG: DUF1566 domain-containing protein [Treponema sp.]|jgi:hypothetical protein|nr:DUF1566 domain-containing protein [Treponema sp.]
MKKLLMLAAIFTLVFTGCPADEENDTGNTDGDNGNNSGINSDVIGIWTARYGTGNAGEVKLDIANKTWVLVFTDPDEYMVTYNGTWTRNGNTLTLLTTGYSTYSVTASLSGGKLVLKQNLTTYYSRPGTCELTKSGSSGGIGGTTFKINNLSDYPLVSVEYSSVDFGVIRSGKDVTKNVNAGTKYIYFVLQTDADGMVRCRTAPVTCEENKNNEIIIVNNTIITITTTEESDTLRNICEKYGVKGMLYDIGDTGPGGGIVFFAEGGQYKECSAELGTYNWTDAMQTAQNYKGGGFTDWSLPDRGELSLMYQNLHIKGLGGFSANNYWSSAEYSVNSSYAWYENFSSGSQDNTYKSNSYRVRAVRSFSF